MATVQAIVMTIVHTCIAARVHTCTMAIVLVHPSCMFRLPCFATTHISKEIKMKKTVTAEIGTCQWALSKTYPTEAIEARIWIGPSAVPEKSSSEYIHHPQSQYVLRSWKKSAHCTNSKGTWRPNVEEYDVQSYRHARQVLWSQIRQSPYSKTIQRKPQNRYRVSHFQHATIKNWWAFSIFENHFFECIYVLTCFFQYEFEIVECVLKERIMPFAFPTCWMYAIVT